MGGAVPPGLSCCDRLGGGRGWQPRDGNGGELSKRFEHALEISGGQDSWRDDFSYALQCRILFIGKLLIAN
jgi:hypothetical protein